MGLDLIELELEVEWEFEIKLPEPEIFAVRTPRQLAELVVRTKCPWADVQERQRILERILHMTADQMGLPPASVKPESDFVNDFGMG